MGDLDRGGLIVRAPVRVRYQDTDCMKVVYYSNYLIYFEVGRVEYLRHQGHPISEIDRRIHMPVVDARVRYIKPARLDDLLEVRCWVSERKRASFTFAYEIVNEAGEMIATGTTLHACMDPGTGKMIGLPAWLQDIIPVVPAADAGGLKREG
jgi:acyl-CoA thioester hydrolase